MHFWADGQKSQYDSGKVELYTNFFHAIFDSEEKLATYIKIKKTSWFTLPRSYINKGLKEYNALYSLST